MLQVPCRCCDATRWITGSQIIIRKFEAHWTWPNQQILYEMFLLNTQINM